MIHGLPAQMVVFQRRNVSGTWQLVTHGDDVGAGVFYHTEAPPEIVCRLANPGFYMVYAQVETGGQTTRLQINNPTAGLLWNSREWKRSTFPQVNTLTHATQTTADPTFTILNRTFMPYMHAAAQWLVQTTAENQFLQLEVTSGVPIAQQPLTLAIWRLHDFAQSTTQQPNAMLGTNFAGSSNVTVTRLTNEPDLFWSPRRSADRYRVIGNAGAIDETVSFDPFDFFVNAPEWAHYVHAGTFTHEVVLRIQSIPGETTTGAVQLTVRRTGAVIAVQQVANYGPALQTYAFPIAAGNRIATVQLSNIDSADRFEFEIELNVTN